jgi:hypothetical protein
MPSVLCPLSRAFFIQLRILTKFGTGIMLLEATCYAST